MLPVGQKPFYGDDRASTAADLASSCGVEILHDQRWTREKNWNESRSSEESRQIINYRWHLVINCLHFLCFARRRRILDLLICFVGNLRNIINLFSCFSGSTETLVGWVSKINELLFVHSLTIFWPKHKIWIVLFEATAKMPRIVSWQNAIYTVSLTTSTFYFWITSSKN